MFVLVSPLAFAQTAATDVPLQIPGSYGQLARLVDIGHGRTLNLRCTGGGARTVMLEAGSHADSTTWFRLQPLLASFTRVCAYDRAGYGFSPAGPLPRNLQADVADLHALIGRARISKPLVLVGHSLGGNIVRRYAEKYPADVAGLVLIDPPAQDVAAFSPGWAKAEAEMNSGRFAFIRQCEAAAEKGELPSQRADLKDCIAQSIPFAGARVQAALNAYKAKPAFWRTLLSELQDNVGVFTQPVPPIEQHGSMPLLVLTASDTYADAPADIRPALEQAREKTQSQITASSTRGERWHVDRSTHDIQLDQPAEVAKAVAKVLQESGHAAQAD
ncbi:MAG: alpha/beta hydrolase [Rhodanobacter sp.]